MTTNQKPPTWEQVFNADGERSRGLWKRGDRYYVQTTVKDPQTGLENVRKILLPKARTEPQARKEAEAVKIKAEKGEIYRKQGSPTLAAFINHYLETCHKSELTVSYEKIYLNRWLEYLGDVRLSTITPAQILSYRTEQLAPTKTERKPVSANSVNKQVIALRNMMRLAKTEGKIEKLPFDGVIQLKHKTKKKPLLLPTDIEKIISIAQENCPKSGKQYVDFVKLASYCGGREQEILALTWDKVHWDTRLIEFSANTKYNKTRFVNFNPKLEAHLKDMQSRKGESNFLFPSHRNKGHTVTSFKTTQMKIEAKTGLDFSDHSFRHYFASMCVMQGVDFMTIARWLGHDDGGILVGKTYGHLNNAHLVEAANKLKF